MEGSLDSLLQIQAQCGQGERVKHPGISSDVISSTYPNLIQQSREAYSIMQGGQPSRGLIRARSTYRTAIGLLHYPRPLRDNPLYDLGAGLLAPRQ